MEETGLVVKVYLDIILLVNFMMDFFILWVTGKAANLPIKLTRLMWGAVLGALYSLVILLPEWSVFSSFFAKNVCAVIMVGVAYRPQSVGKFVRTLAYMYLLSFTMGGAVFAAVSLTDTAPGYIQAWNGMGILWGIHYLWLAIGVVVALFLGYSGLSCLRKSWLQQQLLNSLTIYFQKQKIVVPALLDTGNQLTDPLTKKPVIVVESEALEKVLPKEILQKISEEDSEISELLASLEENWAARLRVIPFNSVGKRHGLMIGFRPDLIVIKNRRKEIITSDVVLGLVNKSLSREGQYRALLHPQILQEH
ncbi:MAG: sigma-E processing peptidase SpoIIGA [Clostridia bacterium]|nr:sigma-E processing peptidase SpoIIGA [Clostridia bacterium]MDD4145826.1 sigma-E processing peptidase SpoIIGA [Clostridia bacterium]MDD4665131.1 sigma-E processing peptidase SpoIIGA [Clostridia bacterium]